MSDDANSAAEEKARVQIDQQLVAAGWSVQSRREMAIPSVGGVAVREMVMAPGASGVSLLTRHGQQALRRAVLAAAFSGRLTGRSSDAEVIEETAGTLANREAMT